MAGARGELWLTQATALPWLVDYPWLVPAWVVDYLPPELSGLKLPSWSEPPVAKEAGVRHLLPVRRQVVRSEGTHATGVEDLPASILEAGDPLSHSRKGHAAKEAGLRHLLPVRRQVVRREATPSGALAPVPTISRSALITASVAISVESHLSLGRAGSFLV